MEGRPIAYARPSFQSKSNPKGAGTPQSKRALRELTLLVQGAVRRLPDWDPTLPVRVDVSFTFARPKAEGGRGQGHGRTEILVEQVRPGHWDTGHADVDNLSKLVMEALQHGGAVKNDMQVVRLKGWKVKERVRHETDQGRD
ncbi:MAG: RusA family crossover junction endodeoxyribonuclease [bacterium]|nr:RusA family crossover junction endodeoxyribonuclease [bacterium]